MSSEFKICIYLKNREKPIILTDVINKDNLHSDVIERFQNIMSSKDEKLHTLDFNNDILLVLNRDIESIKISKPIVNDLEMSIEAVAESNDIDNKLNDEDIVIKKDEESLEGENENDEIFNNTDDDIEVIKE